MATGHLQYQGVPSSRQFFEEQTDLSATKARIVSKYFDAWASVMARVVSQWPDKRIGYIDLFAGPGRYSDGKLSTPLLVLQHAIRQPRIAVSLVAYFNDGDQENVRELRRNIDQLPDIQQLKHTPKVTSLEINEDFVNQFKQRPLPPSFTFIDPFGYKGLSLQLIESVISDWGCDCVFFFMRTCTCAAQRGPTLA